MMRLALLALVGAITAIGVDTASAQMTRPFEALERSRREGIELEKRLKRDAAEQKKREQTQKDAQRQQNLATAKAQKATTPAQPTSKPSQPVVETPAELPSSAKP